MRIDEKSCPKDHYCPVISMCPQGAVSQNNKNEAPQINHTKCTNCGLCKHICPVMAFYN